MPGESEAIWTNKEQLEELKANPRKVRFTKLYNLQED
jgi:ribosomal protein L24E